MTSGERLKRLRKKYKISITELAFEGCSKSQISYMENNKREMNEKLAEQLVEALNSYIGENKINKQDLWGDGSDLAFNRLKEKLEKLDYSEESIKNFENELDKDIMLLGKLQKIELCYPIGINFVKKSDFAKAKKWFDRIFFLINELDNLDWKEDIVEYTIVSLYLSEKFSDIYVYESLIDFHLPSFRDEVFYNICIGLSLTNDRLERYNRALHYIHLLGARGKNLPKDVQMNEAHFLHKLERDEEALTIYKKIINSSNDKHFKAWANHNSIASYIKLKDEKKVMYRIEAVEKALSRGEVESESIPVFYTGLARFLLEMGKTNLAKKRLIKALEYLLGHEISLGAVPKNYNSLNTFLDIVDKDDRDSLWLITKVFLLLNAHQNNEKFYISLTDFFIKNELTDEFVYLKRKYEEIESSRKS